MTLINFNTNQNHLNKSGKFQCIIFHIYQLLMVMCITLEFIPVAFISCLELITLDNGLHTASILFYLRFSIVSIGHPSPTCVQCV